MLAENDLFNLHVFSVKYVHFLFNRADFNLSAVKTGLSLLIHAVYIQTKIEMQAVYMPFTHITYGTNIY